MIQETLIWLIRNPQLLPNQIVLAIGHSKKILIEDYVTSSCNGHKVSIKLNLLARLSLVGTASVPILHENFVTISCSLKN